MKFKLLEELIKKNYINYELMIEVDKYLKSLCLKPNVLFYESELEQIINKHIKDTTKAKHIKAVLIEELAKNHYIFKVYVYICPKCKSEVINFKLNNEKNKKKLLDEMIFEESIRKKLNITKNNSCKNCNLYLNEKISKAAIKETENYYFFLTAYDEEKSIIKKKQLSRDLENTISLDEIKELKQIQEKIFKRCTEIIKYLNVLKKTNPLFEILDIDISNNLQIKVRSKGNIDIILLDLEYLYNDYWKSNFKKRFFNNKNRIY